jgi:hypothetical protein
VCEMWGGYGGDCGCAKNEHIYIHHSGYIHTYTKGIQTTSDSDSDSIHKICTSATWHHTASKHFSGLICMSHNMYMHITWFMMASACSIALTHTNMYTYMNICMHTHTYKHVHAYNLIHDGLSLLHCPLCPRLHNRFLYINTARACRSVLVLTSVW